MKIEVKRSIQNYFEVKNEKLTNRILWAIKWRNECYWEVWISRKETDKFQTTERQIRDIIQNLRDAWLLKLKERRQSTKNKYLCNVYELSQEFKQILNLLQNYIEFLNEKIVQWSKENFEIKLWEYGIKYFRNGRLLNNKWKITYNKRTFIITNWETNKHYNLFNFIKEIYGLSALQLTKEIYVSNI